MSPLAHGDSTGRTCSISRRPPDPLPLVMMLHGPAAVRISPPRKPNGLLADAEGFAVVYPEGVPVRPEKAAQVLDQSPRVARRSGRGRHDHVAFPRGPRRLRADRSGSRVCDRVLERRRDSVSVRGRTCGTRRRSRFGGRTLLGRQSAAGRARTYHLHGGDADPFVPLARRNGPDAVGDGSRAGRPWRTLRARAGHRAFPGVGPLPNADHSVMATIGPAARRCSASHWGGPASPAFDATGEIWEFVRRHRSAEGGPAMALWLCEIEPDCYSIDDLLRDRRDLWDGVGNASARKHLRKCGRATASSFTTRERKRGWSGRWSSPGAQRIQKAMTRQPSPSE